MFKLKLDTSGLLGLLRLPAVADEALKDGARSLTAMGHARALELARDRLRSRRQPFVEGLSQVKVDEYTWMIQLDAKVRWIDDGVKPHEMIDDLLKNARHVGKRGRYQIIPMRQGPAFQGPASQQPMVDAVRAEMKRLNIPFGKIERDDQGNPRLGRLHGFSITHSPLKTAVGPGQGWGPVNDVRQGPNERQKVGGGPGGGGNPFLANVSVYQRHATDKAGKQYVRRDIMTFRVVGEWQKGTGMWYHPGKEGGRIFEDVRDWLTQAWEREVAPTVLARISAAA